jgi:hypothetical protein
VPPTDDDIRESVRAALRGLPSMLNLALMGMSPKRGEAREVARIVRELYAGTEKSLGKDVADELVLPTLEHVKQRIVDLFGTAGWDDSGSAAPAGTTIPVTAPPRRTDEELVSLAYEEDVEGLMQEIRRLRSDVWLERAAEEIAGNPDVCRGPVEKAAAAALAVLRKHRDGKS